MIDISPGLVAVIMLGSFLLLLALGLPFLFALGGTGTLMILLLWGPKALIMLPVNALVIMDWYIIIAVPLFIFMAKMLEVSGVIDNLFQSMQLFFGKLSGGLAIGVVFASVIIGAMSGVAATATLTLGILALPIMLKLGYNKTIAIGPIMAGGVLALLIPPSVSFVIYGALAEVSVGRLFLGGLIPGLILAFMYCVYIGIRCYLQPSLGPSLGTEERISWREKFLSLRSLIMPSALILACLAPIFLGISSTTEAASIGAAGALIIAVIRRRISWPVFKDACLATLKVTSMVGWLIAGAFCLKTVLFKAGVTSLVSTFVTSLDVPPLVVVFLMELGYMLLGCFLDETPIMLLTLPIYLPILTNLGFDTVWFGVLFIINVQMAYLTPPFGFCLFYMKSVVPPDVSTGDIYRSILPFVQIQFGVLTLVMFFPALALWLPNLILGL